MSSIYNFLCNMFEGKTFYEDKAEETTCKLIDAIYDQDFEKCKELVALKMGINGNYNDFTPLILAIRYKNFDIVNLLLENEADPNLSSTNESYPLIIASVGWNDIRIAKKLIEKGAIIDSKLPDRGDTALMMAIRSGNYEMTDFLLSQGSNINEQNYQNDTPLILAVLCKYPKLVELFLERGADINIKDSDDKTAYQHAVERGYDEIIQLFEKKSKLI